MSMSVGVLPSSMCTGCQKYEFDKYRSDSHICDDDGGWTNSSKTGQDPRVDGTSPRCNSFVPR